MSKVSQKALSFAKTAIKAAKLSVEMFNRVEPILWKEPVLIFNAQSWELLLKGILVKKKKGINESDGRTITAEKALNKAVYEIQLLTKEQGKTIGQIISLRNEALHNLLPPIDDEIITHLIYFSISAFNEMLRKEFKSLQDSFEKNYLSIALGNHTFYSNKVEKLFKYSRKRNSPQNHALFLLDRGCEFIDMQHLSKMKTKDEWVENIKKMSKKSRVAYHLPIYDYLGKQDNIRLVPVHVARGHTAAVNVHPTKNPNAPVLIKKTDPFKDYPFLTKEIASKIGKSQNWTALAIRNLNLTGEEYCYRITVSLSKAHKGVPRYSDKALNFLKDYLLKNPDYSPYQRKVKEETSNPNIKAK